MFFLHRHEDPAYLLSIAKQAMVAAERELEAATAEADRALAKASALRAKVAKLQAVVDGDVAPPAAPEPPPTAEVVEADVTTDADVDDAKAKKRR